MGNARITSPSPPGCIIEDEINYAGNDLTNKKTEGYQECADYSASTPGALFWSWSKNSKYCYLKTSNAGKTVYDGLMSGNNKCGKKTALLLGIHSYHAAIA